MRTVVRKLRSRPPHEKRKILYFLTVVTMFAVIFIWTMSLGNRYGERGVQLPKDTTVKKETQSPFSIIGETFRDAYKSAKQ